MGSAQSRDTHFDHNGMPYGNQNIANNNGIDPATNKKMVFVPESARFTLKNFFSSSFHTIRMYYSPAKRQEISESHSNMVDSAEKLCRAPTNISSEEYSALIEDTMMKLLLHINTLPIAHSPTFDISNEVERIRPSSFDHVIQSIKLKR